MKFFSYSILLTVLLVLSSCGDGTVSNVQSTTTSNYQGLQGKKYLVIARVGANDVRSAYENALVNSLEADGVQAAASSVVFPGLDVNQQYSSSDVQDFASNVESKGYDGVIVSVIRSKHKETDTYPVGGDDFYGAYPGYYYGFGGYYMDPMAYPDFGPTEYDTQTYDVYTLNTNVYDLTQPPSKQLVAVVSNDMTDPNNLLSDASEYADKVVASLEKQSK